LNERQTLVHLTYAYSAGFSARMAMKAYLATIGSDKVGFTVVGKNRNGSAELIDGVRGLVERNTLRYYLGIDALLTASLLAPAGQREKRLQYFFTATERYPRQLHEMDRATYMQIKQSEFARQGKLLP
jgi:hypothetical protein